MSSVNPADDLATKIALLSPYTGVALVKDRNLFAGPVRAVRSEVPSQSVFCRNVTGRRPEPYLNNQDDFVPFQVEVTVRSEPGDYGGGEQLARDLLNQLQRQPPTGYITCLAQSAGPELRGESGERQFEFAVIFELWWIAAALPQGALIALLGFDVDGQKNASLAGSGAISTWKNLGSSSVADFTQATADYQPKLKKGAEQSVSFDGVFDRLSSAGSKSALGFIHSTGVFDLLFVLRRTNTCINSERRIFGGSEGQKGLGVLFNTAADGEGSFWVILGNGTGLVSNYRTTMRAPLGQPYKVLFRGDGSTLKVSHDFAAFETQSFLLGLGSGDAFYDYSIGAANPSQVTPLTLEADVMAAVLYNRNLSATELTQFTTFVEQKIGRGA